MSELPIANSARGLELRQWRWPPMPPYNGFSHAERVRGWQLINLLVEVGQIEKPRQCVISGATEGLQLHLEDYYGWQPYVLCQPVHMALHKRFREPQKWQAIVDRYACGGEWFANLSPTPVDLAGDLRRLHGEGVADIFSRAPIRYDLD